jgi:hypothetical protein
MTLFDPENLRHIFHCGALGTARPTFGLGQAMA